MTASSFEATAEFQHFKNTMRRVLAVPKGEVDKMLERKKRALEKKRKRPKPPRT